MIGSRSREDWEIVSRDPVQVVRSLADWVADILTVMRVVSSAAGLAGLADSRPGTAYYHAEQVRHWLVHRVTGGLTGTDITPELVGRWVATSADRNQALTELADELADLLVVLNAASGGGSGLWTLAVGTEGGPYWHAGRAHMHVLGLLVGNIEDGYTLHELWSDNQEPTARNLPLLHQHKRTNALVITIAEDGNTATVTAPDGGVCHAGRTGGGGLYWVTAANSDDIIAHNPSWQGIAHQVIDYYNFPADTRVIVEYPAPATPPPEGTAPDRTAPGAALSSLGDTVNTSTDAVGPRPSPFPRQREIPGVSTGDGITVSADTVAAATTSTGVGAMVHADHTGTGETAVSPENTGR